MVLAAARLVMVMDTQIVMNMGMTVCVPKGHVVDIAMMIVNLCGYMRFKTESGSEYLIDPGTMGWCRTSKAEKSGEIRKDFGTLLELPMIVVGKAAILHDTSTLPGHIYHAVITSIVTEISEET